MALLKVPIQMEKSSNDVHGAHKFGGLRQPLYKRVASPTILRPKRFKITQSSTGEQLLKEAQRILSRSASSQPLRPIQVQMRFPEQIFPSVFILAHQASVKNTAAKKENVQPNLVPTGLDLLSKEAYKKSRRQNPTSNQVRQ